MISAIGNDNRIEDMMQLPRGGLSISILVTTEKPIYIIKIRRVY